MTALKKISVYILRGITLLIAVSVICFILVNISPVDPVLSYRLANPGASPEHIARIESFWGVHESPIERYFNWVSAVLSGDFSESLIFRRPVIEIVGARFGATLALMLSAWTLSGLFGFGVGSLMGIFHGRPIDRIVKRICLVMYSLPTFWIGLVFLIVFSVWLGWFPFGMAMPIGIAAEDVTIWQRLHHLVLPSVTISFLSFPNIALHTREKLVEVMASDHVLFAKARGKSRWEILLRHGFRGTLIPAMTMQFASFGELFGGSIIAENIFGFPGLGSAVSAAGLQGDIPLLLGITLFSAIFIFTGNAIANALYIIIDPRTREGER